MKPISFSTVYKQVCSCFVVPQVKHEIISKPFPLSRAFPFSFQDRAPWLDSTHAYSKRGRSFTPSCLLLRFHPLLPPYSHRWWFFYLWLYVAHFGTTGGPSFSSSRLGRSFPRRGFNGRWSPCAHGFEQKFTITAGGATIDVEMAMDSWFPFLSVQVRSKQTLNALFMNPENLIATSFQTDTMPGGRKRGKDRE